MRLEYKRVFGEKIITTWTKTKENAFLWRFQDQRFQNTNSGITEKLRQPSAATIPYHIKSLKYCPPTYDPDTLIRIYRGDTLSCRETHKWKDEFVLEKFSQLFPGSTERLDGCCWRENVWENRSPSAWMQGKQAAKASLNKIMFAVDIRDLVSHSKEGKGQNKAQKEKGKVTTHYIWALKSGSLDWAIKRKVKRERQGQQEKILE